MPIPTIDPLGRDAPVKSALLTLLGVVSPKLPGGQPASPLPGKIPGGQPVSPLPGWLKLFQAKPGAGKGPTAVKKLASGQPLSSVDLIDVMQQRSNAALNKVGAR
jgi:hypothetical protein